MSAANRRPRPAASSWPRSGPQEDGGQPDGEREDVQGGSDGHEHAPILPSPPAREG